MKGPAAGACRETLARISAYLDGELPADACDDVEAHCAACAPCAEFVEGLRNTIGACRAAGAAPLPDDLRARALARVRRLMDAS